MTNEQAVVLQKCLVEMVADPANFNASRYAPNGTDLEYWLRKYAIEENKRQLDEQEAKIKAWCKSKGFAENDMVGRFLFTDVVCHYEEQQDELDALQGCMAMWHEKHARLVEDVAFLMGAVQGLKTAVKCKPPESDL